jgi:integrase
MSVGKTRRGNWYVQYRVPGQSSPLKEYFGKGEGGLVGASHRQEEIRSGRLFTRKSLEGKDLYMDQLSQLYLDYLKSQDRTRNWLKMLVYLINDHYLPVLSHTKVDRLTVQDVVTVAGRFTDLSAATQNRYLDSLNAIFRFGIKHKLTINNPMNGWSKHREPKRVVRLTVSDLGKIYQHSEPYLQWILEVQWELGTRPGKSELFSIRWDDVDFDLGQIRVRGTKTRGSDRIIPITDRFKDRLLERRQIARTGFVVEFRGHPISRCHHGLLAACREAGIEYPVRLYDLRHLSASSMLAGGADLKAVSKILGHSSTRMTADTYYHELKGEKERAVDCRQRPFG